MPVKTLTSIYTAVMSREPVATVGLLRQFFYMLMAFGLVHWTLEQVGVSLIFAESLLTWLVRSSVVTTAKYEKTVNAALDMPSGSTRGDLAAAVVDGPEKTPKG